MNPQELTQGSPEWLAYKCGRLGGASISQMMARSRDGKTWGVTRANLKARLVAERLSGCPSDSYVSEAMRRGMEMEGEAAQLYAAMHDADLTTVGYFDHPVIPMAGASPDRLAGSDGLVEIKCPEPKKHMETLLGAPIDREYLIQVQWQMACTGRKWVDFCSYDGRWPAQMRLHVRRVARDDVMISNLEIEAAIFLKEVSDTVTSLREQYDVVLEAAE